MDIKVVPFAPKFATINGKEVQIGDELYAVITKDYMGKYNYNNAQAGDHFNAWSNIYGIWEEPTPFSATLEIISPIHKDRVLVVDNSINRHYSFIHSDFVELTKNAEIKYGSVTGDFEFVKRGNAFGIRLR